MLEKDVIFQLFLYLMILDVYRFYLYIKFIGWIKRKSEKQLLSRTKRQITSREKSTLNEKFEHIDVDKCDIPQNLPVPNIQIHNEINNLAIKKTLPLIANNKKRNNQKSYKKKNQADDEYLDKVDHIDLTQYEDQQDILYQILSHRRQRRSVNLKQLLASLDVPIQNDSMPSTSESSTKAISSQHTEKTTIKASIKRKKFDEFNDLPTKHIKSNANNTQSILEKILEEQLRQRTTIKAIEESNAELKCEILENHKLIQKMFTNFTLGLLNTEQTQQGGR
ncbi:unnamed protein product [Rhizophagus irregularis]|nr:unnamed protein product [Rhizophagus irregularis]